MTPEEQKAADAKAAADKAAAEASAKSAAPSVAAQAAAQKKVADARAALEAAEAELAKSGGTRATTAVEDSKKVAAGDAPIVIAGRAGGPFSIDGEGFGNVKGHILIGNRIVDTTRWIDRSIKGMLPADLEPGDVTVKATGVDRKGKWPPVVPAPAPAAAPAK